jgi:DNA-binding NarL/FixJ family response regulator
VVIQSLSAHNPIRVLIADDHPVSVKGILAELQPYPHIQIVGTVASFAAALLFLKDTSCDVVILDITGMDGSAVATVEQLRRLYPATAIVIFSANVSFARELVRIGALGYVTKDEVLDHLVHAIHSTSHGQPFYSPLVQQHLNQVADAQLRFRLAPSEELTLKLRIR